MFSSSQNFQGNQKTRQGGIMVKWNHTGEQAQELWGEPAGNAGAEPCTLLPVSCCCYELQFHSLTWGI